MSDNTFITINPLGKEYYCFYESPFINQISPSNLTTIRGLDLTQQLGLIMNSSHAHYDEHGNMITIGLKIGPMGPEYVIQKTRPTEESLLYKSQQNVSSLAIEIEGSSLIG